MPYCTQTDIERSGLRAAELIMLADDDGDGVADAAVLTETIAQADAIIDSYLAARYTVPLTTVPATIRGASVAIAVKGLYARRGKTNEAREQAFKDAIAYLSALSKGAATLGVASPPAATEEGGPEATHAESDRTFTMGKTSDGSVGSLDNY